MLLIEYAKYLKMIIVTGISAVCLLHYVVSSVILHVEAENESQNYQSHIYTNF